MKNDDKPDHHGNGCHTRKSEKRDKKVKSDVQHSVRVANFPLERVELKRFEVDVMLCGDETWSALGQPWITTAVDAYSRMVVGCTVDCESSNGSAMGVCIGDSILPKKEWLQQNEAVFRQKLEWPCHGLPQTLYVGDFRTLESNSLAQICDRYGICIEFGGAKSSQCSDRIEHLISQETKQLRRLTTLSHSDQRDWSDGSEERSAIGWLEFKRWLTVLICGIYHNRPYPDLDGKSPLERWKQGVESTSTSAARQDCYFGKDIEQLRIDFLPSIKRAVTRKGVQIDAIRYMGPSLWQWIDAGHSKNQNRLGLFTFRRDPQDISIIYFWNPKLEKYEPIPRCDGFQSSMTIWEWRAFMEHHIATSKMRFGEVVKAMIRDLARKM